MEQLLPLFKQVGDIIVRAVPAFIVFVLLHLYLKKMIFKPLEGVLEERRKKTQGAVEASEALVREAANRMDTYEHALSEARAVIYKEQEANRRLLAAQQAENTSLARQKVNQRIEEARTSIQAEVDQAMAQLTAEAERLAEGIAGAILAGRN